VPWLLRESGKVTPSAYKEAPMLGGGVGFSESDSFSLPPEGGELHQVSQVDVRVRECSSFPMAGLAGPSSKLRKHSSLCQTLDEASTVASQVSLVTASGAPIQAGTHGPASRSKPNMVVQSGEPPWWGSPFWIPRSIFTSSQTRQI
jgi:hypothetical protein